MRRKIDRLLILLENKFLPKKQCQCYTHHGFNVSKNNPKSFIRTPLAQKQEAPSNLKYTIEGDDSNTDEENARLPAIESRINNYIQEQQFHDFFCNPANGLDLQQTEGESAEEVVSKIRSSTAHIKVVFYYDRWTRTIGYRNPGENIVYCNRKYHDSYSTNDESSNVLHEFLHIIDVTGPLCGYQHDFEDTPRRPFSVNYMANSAIEADASYDFF